MKREIVYAAMLIVAATLQVVPGQKEQVAKMLVHVAYDTTEPLKEFYICQIYRF